MIDRYRILRIVRFARKCYEERLYWFVDVEHAGPGAFPDKPIESFFVFFARGASIPHAAALKVSGSRSTRS